MTVPSSLVAADSQRAIRFCIPSTILLIDVDNFTVEFTLGPVCFTILLFDSTGEFELASIVHFKQERT